MSDTPETDAVFLIEGNWDTKALRMYKFSQKLERELYKAKTREQVCFDLHAALGVKWGDDPYAAINGLKRERDQAREQRDEWRITASSLKAGEGELLKKNAKLRDIIKRAINFGEDRAPYLAYPGPTWEKLRAELDQLKEDAK